MHLFPDRVCGLLQLSQSVCGVWKVWVHKRSDHGGSGEQLVQQPQSLHLKVIGEEAHPCDIAARPTKAGDEAELHRIGAAAEEGFAPRLWTASLTLPAPRGSKPMRLIIKEYEHLHVDAGDRSNIMAVGSAERLVYADAIDI